MDKTLRATLYVNRASSMHVRLLVFALLELCRELISVYVLLEIKFLSFVGILFFLAFFSVIKFLFPIFYSFPLFLMTII